MKKDWLCDDTYSMKKDWLYVGATSSMKTGWLCRTYCDKKNEEIAPFDWDSESNDDDPVMLQIKWWSRIDDDPVMI